MIGKYVTYTPFSGPDKEGIVMDKVLMVDITSNSTNPIHYYLVADTETGRLSKVCPMRVVKVKIPKIYEDETFLDLEEEDDEDEDPGDHPVGWNGFKE